MSPDRLIELGLLAARLGVTGAGLLALAGVVVLALGQRAFRPTAALVAAAGGAYAVALATSHWDAKLPVSLPLSLAAGAVAFLVFGLLAPRAALLVTAAVFGAAAGIEAGRHFPEWNAFAILGGAMAGGVVAGILMSVLPTIVPPLVGALALALGAWGVVGASGASPALFRLPVLWLVVAGLFGVVGIALERARFARREVRSAKDRAKAEAEAKARRDEEDRKRYARYLE